MSQFENVFLSAKKIAVNQLAVEINVEKAKTFSAFGMNALITGATAKKPIVTFLAKNRGQTHDLLRRLLNYCKHCKTLWLKHPAITNHAVMTLSVSAASTKPAPPSPKHSVRNSYEHH